MGIMKIASPLWGSRSSTAMGLTVTAIAIAVILLASNFTIINAQQSLTSQPGEIENGATTTVATVPTTTTAFQSTNDSFSIQVPDGWVIHDVNNTGSTLLEETTRGYGILAQLCPEEEEQQQQGAALPNTNSGSTNSSSISTSNVCQGSEEVIHIIRYPDLDTRIQPASNVTTTTTTNNNNMTTDDVVSYHLQKLQEVGYRSMQIVNSTETTLNLTNAQTNQPIAIVPAKLVEMAYSTNFAPNEIRKGYFISTATNATAPNLGTTKGYAIFYEGNSTTISTAAAIQTATAASGSLAPTVLPPAVGQVFDSFELIAAAEGGQEAAQAAEIAEGDDDGANGDDDNGSDNDDNDDDDDNGSDNDDGISSRGPEHASDDYDGDDDDGDDDYDGDDDDGGDDDGA